jgi:predicted nucleotidyltransferase
MQRPEIIEKLRAHRAGLCAAGIVHLRLHGSVARGEASSNSDVNLIAEFEPGRRFTLIDMVKLENRLRELLGVKVDLSPANTLKEPVRRRAEREAVLGLLTVRSVLFATFQTPSSVSSNLRKGWISRRSGRI